MTNDDEFERNDALYKDVYYMMAQLHCMSMAFTGNEQELGSYEQLITIS
jgi:hypothetical protein